MAKIEATIYTWCREIGIQEKTLNIRLTKAGYSYEQRDLISAKAIIDAMCGDKEKAMTAKLEQQAEQIALKNKKFAGELVDLPAADHALWQNLLMPLKQELDLLPSKLSVLVAPESPKAAEKVIFEYVEELKKKLLKVKKPK